MTLTEAARVCRVDIRTVRRWIHAGTLRATATAQGYRITQSDLAAAKLRVTLKKTRLLDFLA